MVTAVALIVGRGIVGVGIAIELSIVSVRGDAAVYEIDRAKDKMACCSVRSLSMSRVKRVPVRTT